MEDLSARFAGQQMLVNLCCVVTGLAFLFLTHFALTGISHGWMNADGMVGYRVAGDPAIWWFFPGFGALCLGFEITLQVWALFVGHRVVNLYSEWASRQPKKTRSGIAYYDSRKVLRWFALLVALPIGVASGLALRMHTTFSGAGISEFGYGFAQPKVHGYGEIRQVVRVLGVWGKHRRFVPRPFLVIDFTDGERWSQEEWDDSRAAVTDGAQAYLEKHLTFPVGFAFSIEELPRPALRR